MLHLRNNPKKKQKSDMPQKDKENQDVFKRGRKISGDWFDSAIKRNSPDTTEQERDESLPNPNNEEKR